MIRQTDIFTAINRMLVDVYPERIVYPKEPAKDFNRSSFFIEFVRISSKDVSRTTVEKTVYFTITCFVPPDKNKAYDREELASIQDNILQELQKGYINVCDRALHIKASSGGMDTDRAYIDLQFEYFDNRTDEVDQTPIATSVTTRIQEV
jgi:hypothetical protein